MLNLYQIKERLRWPIIRAHLSTLALSVCLNSIWRVPRDGFRYGGLRYGIILTVAMVTISLPVTLLQLAVGQLSQQDAVGVWKAVPFFRGVGYVRILVSLLGASYTIIYVALTVAYFLYTSVNSIPFPSCTKLEVFEGEYYENTLNSSECLSTTLMSPIRSGPEYYMSLGLMSVALWTLSPFVFYNPVKFMKRIFYAVTPMIIVIGILVVSFIGDSDALHEGFMSDGFSSFNEPYIWHSAVVQALWSCQIAGGFLISAGDSIYSNTNVDWTSIIIVVTNIFSCWMSLVFWYAISGYGAKNTSVVAVLLQTYQVTQEEELRIAWPLMVFIMIILAGLVSMLTLLYPLYDRVRRMGGIRWRVAASAASVVAAALTLALLAGQLPLLTLVEDVAAPLLLTTATIAEILVFGFFYGWKNLIEDIEFLKGGELVRYWVWGWWLSPVIILPLTVWWVTDVFLQGVGWSDPPWEAATITFTVLIGLAIIVLCASVAVGRQEQYDILEKLKSSFQPSRHWGPRDPITHYYWLASREGSNGNLPRVRYNRRELGQLSTRPSFLTVSETVSKENIDLEDKKRSNSDDWLYTTGRKQHLLDTDNSKTKRSNSLSLDRTNTKNVDKSSVINESAISNTENNNNLVGFKYVKNVKSKYNVNCKSV